MWEYNRDKHSERGRTRQRALFVWRLIKTASETGNKLSMQLATHPSEPRAASFVNVQESVAGLGSQWHCPVQFSFMAYHRSVYNCPHFPITFLFSSPVSRFLSWYSMVKQIPALPKKHRWISWADVRHTTTYEMNRGCVIEDVQYRPWRSVGLTVTLKLFVHIAWKSRRIETEGSLHRSILSTSMPMIITRPVHSALFLFKVSFHKISTQTAHLTLKIIQPRPLEAHWLHLR